MDKQTPLDIISGIFILAAILCVYAFFGVLIAWATQVLTRLIARPMPRHIIDSFVWAIIFTPSLMVLGGGHGVAYIPAPALMTAFQFSNGANPFLNIWFYVMCIAPFIVTYWVIFSAVRRRAAAAQNKPHTG